mmetsp:Transcript_22590/g.40183  ORF Transcript_22590/g.40183 Transcript_22590/m.40183 type:complete len:253 (+) Transcript_22590:2-760(+)
MPSSPKGGPFGSPQPMVGSISMNGSSEGNPPRVIVGGRQVVASGMPLSQKGVSLGSPKSQFGDTPVGTFDSPTSSFVNSSTRVGSAQRKQPGFMSGASGSTSGMLSSPEREFLGATSKRVSGEYAIKGSVDRKLPGGIRLGPGVGTSLPPKGGGSFVTPNSPLGEMPIKGSIDRKLPGGMGGRMGPDASSSFSGIGGGPSSNVSSMKGSGGMGMDGGGAPPPNSFGKSPLDRSSPNFGGERDGFIFGPDKNN